MSTQRTDARLLRDINETIKNFERAHRNMSRLYWQLSAMMEGVPAPPLPPEAERLASAAESLSPEEIRASAREIVRKLTQLVSALPED